MSVPADAITRVETERCRSYEAALQKLLSLLAEYGINLDYPPTPGGYDAKITIAWDYQPNSSREWTARFER